MNYTRLSQSERDALWRALVDMPSYLQTSFACLSAEEAARPGPDDSFSPIEQVWHLADLEVAGFGERIRRLRTESHPRLADFDGKKVAMERDYRSLALADGLSAFARARLANIAVLRSLTAEDWSRSGEQDGLGLVCLSDIPALMGQHDSAHRHEIEAWKAQTAN